MGRGRNSNPKAANIGDEAKRRHTRGRPRVEWTESRKRKLLRLYLGVPASVLSLRDIRLILSQDDFKPAERKTQEVLQSLLANGYNKRRPATKAVMAKRLSFFRSLRYKARSMAARTAPSVESSDTQSTLVETHTQAAAAASAGTVCDGLEVGLDRQFLPIFHADGYGDSTDSWPDQPLVNRHISGGLIEPEKEDFVVNATLLTEKGQKRADRIEFLRRKLPGSRTSSVLDRIASILSSNLSLRSDVSRCASLASTSSSGLSSKPRQPVPATPPPLQVGTGRTGPGPDALGNRGASMLISVSDEEVAVLEGCCSKPSLNRWKHCVHQRLKHVIRHSITVSSRMAFPVTDQELNAADRLGNTLLHVVTRWGGSLSLLHFLIEQGANPNTRNGNGETFLHLFHPWSDASLTPSVVYHLISSLNSRFFNFCLLDFSGRSFLQTWIQSSAATLSLLEPFLGTLPKYARHHLLGDQTSGGRLFQSWLLSCPDSPCPRISVRVYMIHLVTKYSHGRPLDLPEPDIPETGCKLPLPRAGWNSLHQFVAAAHLRLNLHETSGTVDASPADKDRLYLDTLDTILAAASPLDVNNTELITGHTPLMTLLWCWATAPPADGAFFTSVLTRLVRAGASVHARDNGGLTPLHHAVAEGLGEAVQALCRAGADADAEARDGATPLELARRGIRAEIRRAGSPGQDVVVLSRLLECGTILLDFGAGRSERGEGGGQQRWDPEGLFDWGRYLAGDDGVGEGGRERGPVGLEVAELWA